MKVEEENEILKDLLSYAIGDWDLELKDDEGMGGTLTDEMKDIGVSKGAISYFKKNYMYKEDKKKRMKVYY